MLKVAPTLKAEADLLAIWQFIANHNSAAADRYNDQIWEKITLLAQMPDLGTRLNELHGDIRYFTAGNHVVFYRVSVDTLEIIRVLHSARDFLSLLD